MDKLLEFYEDILHVIAKFTVHSLELIGVSIVIFGTFKILIHSLKRLRDKSSEYPNTVITFGRNLGLALQFKMGAEIVNTVIVRSLQELLILGIVIVLRAILAVLIHWEITTEEKEEKAHQIALENAQKTEETFSETADDKK